MKKKKKKPDNVVYNEEEEKYDAAIKPYGTNVGAPSIIPSDTVDWKNRHIQRVNHQISTRYNELKAEYEQMMEQFEYNNLLYNASYKFEPIVGQVYHLYDNSKTNEPFLSLIAPNECNFEHLGSFRLNADSIWEKEE